MPVYFSPYCCPFLLYLSCFPPLPSLPALSLRMKPVQYVIASTIIFHSLSGRISLYSCIYVSHASSVCSLYWLFFSLPLGLHLSFLVQWQHLLIPQFIR